MKVENMFCNLSDLRNESDVEQFFVIRLLKSLGYKDSNIHTKETFKVRKIGKGREKKDYKPDYLIYVEKYPVIAIDAKNPNDNPDAGLSDALMYAREINGEYTGKNPIRYCIGTNGVITKICKWDENEPFLVLDFEDFQFLNETYIELTQKISYAKIREDKTETVKSIKRYRKPSIEEIKATFQECHNIIWKRDNLLPAEAFSEFSKLIFLKLNEDKRIRKLIDAGEKIEDIEFYFHKNWIQKNQVASPNPINTILFRNLCSELAELVEKKKKKPIFDEDEEIKVRPSTIEAVVEKLQEIDLYGIDEDLNGRMFEVFLNAVVRGKQLGAYFTPRDIVKLMVRIANLQLLKIEGNLHIDRILDGCCGSGGFLIEAMAVLFEKLKRNKSLQSDKERIEIEIAGNHIFGIEKNPNITRVARINMYVHGDGGSRIYHADTLDKDIQIEPGEIKKSKKEHEELQELLFENKQGLKFDVILTNPPFALPYSKDDEHEKKILEQYGSPNPSDNITYKKGSNELKNSVKTNILFLARYLELLKDGGRLLIVLDNSLLNSHSNKSYRIWITDNFIIRAIISLPKYSFIQAGAGGVTSILYLEKRKNTDQQQPPIFARSVEYTGISKSGKEIPQNDLLHVEKEYLKYEETGELYLYGTEKINDYEYDRLFLINPSMIKDRLDVSFYSPSYRKLMRKLEELENSRKIKLKKITDFETLSKINYEDNEDKFYCYVDIGALDKERGIINIEECEEGLLSDLTERARQIINENDVIFPLSYDSLGKVAIIQKELDGQLASTGFVGIKCNSYEEATMIWAIIRSDIVQKQFRHIASGYTQREIGKEYLKNFLKLPLPLRSIDYILQTLNTELKTANESRKREKESYNKIEDIINNAFE